MARTDTLTNFLTDVASAIKTKKGDQTDILASDFDTEIANLPSGGDPYDYFMSDGVNTSNPKIIMQLKKIPKMALSNNATSLYQTFSGCLSVEEIDVSLFTKSGITNMQQMFQNCEKLETITGFENIDTSSVTTMSSTFYYCKKLKNIDLSNLDSTSLTSMNSAFYQCNSLESIILGFTGSLISDMSFAFYYCTGAVEISLPNFTGASLSVAGLSTMFQNCSSAEEISMYELGTCNVNNLSNMFRSCASLKRIIMPKFNTTNTINSSGANRIFFDCRKLETLDMRSFDWTRVTANSSTFDYVPNNCEIIVADATQKAWFNNGEYTSRFTNVKTVAELGVE